MASRDAFIQHYRTHYPTLPTAASTPASGPAYEATTDTNSAEGDEFFSVFTRGRHMVSAPQHELDAFFALSPDNYATSSDPVKWWASW
jgi:hypothetical protein